MSLTSSFWASSWASFASLRCAAFFWARELIDARLRLQKHAQNVRIDTDGWESVLDLTWRRKKIASNHSVIANKTTEQKKRKINNSVSNRENIKKALVTDGKSERGRRKPRRKKSNFYDLKNLRWAHIPKPLYFGSSKVHFYRAFINTLQHLFSTSSYVCKWLDLEQSASEWPCLPTPLIAMWWYRLSMSVGYGQKQWRWYK